MFATTSTLPFRRSWQDGRPEAQGNHRPRALKTNPKRGPTQTETTNQYIKKGAPAGGPNDHTECSHLPGVCPLAPSRKPGTRSWAPLAPTPAVGLTIQYSPDDGPRPRYRDYAATHLFCPFGVHRIPSAHPTRQIVWLYSKVYSMFFKGFALVFLSFPMKIHTKTRKTCKTDEKQKNKPGKTLYYSPTRVC